MLSKLQDKPPFRGVFLKKKKKTRAEILTAHLPQVSDAMSHLREADVPTSLSRVGAGICILISAGIEYGPRGRGGASRCLPLVMVSSSCFPWDLAATHRATELHNIKLHTIIT